MFTGTRKIKKLLTATFILLVSATAVPALAMGCMAEHKTAADCAKQCAWVAESPLAYALCF